MPYRAWRKPDHFRKSNYVPWMDSYLEWNLYRIILTVIFVSVVIAGVILSIGFLGILAIQFGKVFGL